MTGSETKVRGTELALNSIVNESTTMQAPGKQNFVRKLLETFSSACMLNNLVQRRYARSMHVRGTMDGHIT